MRGKNLFLKNSMLPGLILLGIMILAPVSIIAQSNDKPVADINIGSGGIQWVPKVSYYQLSLTVSRPDGSVFSRKFDASQTPYLDISEIYGKGDCDGSYTYEMKVIGTSPRKRMSDNEKAFSGTNLSMEPVTQTGHFSVKGGMLISNTLSETPSVAMDVNHLDDVIITGSICVGFDCLTDGTESFGLDTIRLKENTLRIKFDDTSTSAGFPANDWQLTANDSASGGANFFSIDDITGSKVPFKIVAGARSNSLFVSSTGKVGLGTGTPIYNLHITYGDSPTVRFEQDGSYGWSPQSWDIVGNESNFFIRDVTAGSKLPFRIQPGAPTNTLTLKADGRVGIGTWVPGYQFEVSATGTGADIVATRTDGASFQVNAAGNYGYTGTRTDHPVRVTVNSIWKMQINGSGHLIDMSDGGYYDGTWTDSSSRKVKENIADLSAQDAVNAFNNLSPVTFNYIANKEEQHVGFIAEDVPELVASQNRSALSPMDIVAVLTKVVQEQQKTLQEQTRMIETQQKSIDELKAKISGIEKK